MGGILYIFISVGTTNFYLNSYSISKIKHLICHLTGLQVLCLYIHISGAELNVHILPTGITKKPAIFTVFYSAINIY